MKNLIIVIHIFSTLLLVGCADKGVYVGEKKDGKRHGQGKFKWSDGDKYVGELKNVSLFGGGGGEGGKIFSNFKLPLGRTELISFV